MKEVRTNVAIYSHALLCDVKSEHNLILCGFESRPCTSGLDHRKSVHSYEGTIATTAGCRMVCLILFPGLELTRSSLAVRNLQRKPGPFYHHEHIRTGD